MNLWTQIYCTNNLCSLNQSLEIVYSEVPKLPTSWFIPLTSLRFILALHVHTSGYDILSKEKKTKLMLCKNGSQMHSVCYYQFVLICTASEQTGKVVSVDVAAAAVFPVALRIFTFYLYNDRVYSYPQHVNYKHLLSFIVPALFFILHFF